MQTFAIDVNACPKIAALLETQKEAGKVKFKNLSDFVDKAIKELLEKEAKNA
jgi:Arc/MetJ-type ribon-helix-helix transcriptional regulator